jgi:hypothetical protein
LARRGDVIVLPCVDQHRMAGVEDAGMVPLSMFMQMPPWRQLPVLRPAADGEQTDVVVLRCTVYAKTGASSRAAAPAYAYDQGLTGCWPPAHDHAGAAAVGPASIHRESAAGSSALR